MFLGNTAALPSHPSPRADGDLYGASYPGHESPNIPRDVGQVCEVDGRRARTAM